MSSNVHHALGLYEAQVYGAACSYHCLSHLLPEK